MWNVQICFGFFYCNACVIQIDYTENKLQKKKKLNKDKNKTDFLPKTRFAGKVLPPRKINVGIRTIFFFN